MSDPKRVTFETISSGSSKSLASDGASTKDEQAVRLELKLFEPNADSFPQFNFKKLCRAEKVMKKNVVVVQTTTQIRVYCGFYHQKIIVGSVLTINCGSKRSGKT